LLSALTLLGASGAWQAQTWASPQQRAAADASVEQAVLDRYCVSCHNSRLNTAGLALDSLDVGAVAADAGRWEQVLRKVRAGVMPPIGRPRPDQATYEALIAHLERELDRAAAERPNPGRTETFHRLNRAEYRNAVRDLLGVEVDVADLLPPDDASYGFDNIAGVLRFSPTLMDRYLAAASAISARAVGKLPSAPNADVFRIADDLPQNDRMEGLPFGTRGGTRIDYTFPATGEYAVRVRLARQVGVNDQSVPNFHQPQQLEVTLNGERLTVFELAASQPASRRRAAPSVDADQVSEDDRNRNDLDADWEVRFQAKAGPATLGVTFLTRSAALIETLIEPYMSPYPPGDRTLASRKGAYLRSVEVLGPFTVGPAADPPSRRRTFICQPSDEADEPACARTILRSLARRAYRRPVTDEDIGGLLASFGQGRESGGFEAGIELAIQRLLVSPEFLFRIAAVPPGVAPETNYPVGDVELASRLSFFLWSSIPDDELLAAAERGELRNPVVLERQVRRMLADGRSGALTENFLGQWLLLRNLPAVRPDPHTDPDFDESLRLALRRETELFFESIVQEDRSVIELLSADYTFLNERLAKHYGIPHVYGSHFRRVTLPEGSPRGGLLGQGSVLAVTSHANRTSPVARGKWILENILGTPPPAPPPNVPELEEVKDPGRVLTMRERMAEHRANPVCASCHLVMDPLGLPLENFDQSGRWRTVDVGADSRRGSFTAIDVSGALPDGTTFNGPAEMRDALVARADDFVLTLTEKLLTYALGRGLEYYDMPAVRAIVRDAARDNYRFTSLVLGIANSLPFQMRRSPAFPRPVAAHAVEPAHGDMVRLTSR
jgi:hypothetical protein